MTTSPAPSPSAAAGSAEPMIWHSDPQDPADGGDVVIIARRLQYSSVLAEQQRSDGVPVPPSGSSLNGDEELLAKQQLVLGAKAREAQLDRQSSELQLRRAELPAAGSKQPGRSRSAVWTTSS